MTLYLSNLAAYSLQLAILVAVAFAVTALLRMRAPVPALRFWQAVLAAGLLLPLIQPWPADRSDVLASSVVFVSGTAPATALATRGIDWVQTLLAVLGAGAIARLLWLGIGILRLRAIVAHATPDEALASLTRELSAATGSRATLLISDDIESPVTVGIRRPLILVPRRMREMPQPVQRAVIAHELVHVRRRDWLHTLAEEIWCALLWFHPAARVVSTRLSLARETVVDEQTILLTRDRRAYVEALLSFADPQPYLVGMTPLIGRVISASALRSSPRRIPCPAAAPFQVSLLLSSSPPPPPCSPSARSPSPPAWPLRPARSTTRVPASPCRRWSARSNPFTPLPPWRRRSRDRSGSASSSAKAATSRR